MLKTKLIFFPEYKIKVKSKKDSLEFLKARLNQLRVEGKDKSREGQCILAILRHQD